MPEPQSPAFGANSWLVEEMYERFIADPDSVGESWKEFFDDYQSVAPANANAHHSNGSASAAQPAAAPTAQPAPAAPAPAPTPTPAPATGDEGPGAPIRGVAARIVENMEHSLTVPTATSFRNMPAKLLEVNRKVINGYRERAGQGKVSFTHLIGYAIVRAIADAVPNMRNGFVTGPDGKPRLVTNSYVNMGLAVDVDKGDGAVGAGSDADVARAGAARSRRHGLRGVPRRVRGDHPQGPQ